MSLTKMFKPAICAALLITTFNQASATELNDDQIRIQKSLSSIFSIASKPIESYRSSEGREIDYVLRNFGVKPGDAGVDGSKLATDVDYCLDQQEGNSWKAFIPFYGAQFRVKGNWYSEFIEIKDAKHANEPRCQKFKLSYYKNFPRFLNSLPKAVPGTESEVNDSKLYAALPETFIHSVVLPNYANRSIEVFGQQLENAVVSLGNIAKRKDISSMEVCAAVALADVVRNTVENLYFEKPNDPSLVGSGGNSIARNQSPREVIQYVNRVKFLAYSVSDWIAKTNGNSNLCPNFGLELRVDELTSRVAQAESAIRGLSSQVASLRSEIRQMKASNNRREIISTVGFWSLGFMGYKLLTPR